MILKRFLTTISLVLTLFICASANAHFVLDSKTRIIAVSDYQQATKVLSAAQLGKGAADGVVIFMRIPTPLIYAAALAKRAHPNASVDAPFLREQLLQGTPFYLLDKAKIVAASDEFLQFVADGYQFRVNGKPQQQQALAFRIHANRDRPHFNQLDGIGESFATPIDINSDVYVGDSVVDCAIFLPQVSATDVIAVSSALPRLQLPPDIDLLNVGIDLRNDPPISIQKNGQLQREMTFDNSRSVEFWHYLQQGVEHILIGADHVLFVLCLVLVSGFSWRLLWAVSGFTVGHSITFALGALGIYPQVAWFIPTIELVIAASIIIAAALVFWQRRAGNNLRGVNLLALTIVIGLIHGYGFAFVFSELIGDIQTQIAVLVAFNVGVEMGQLLVVAIALSLFKGVDLLGAKTGNFIRASSALLAIVVASYWLLERSWQLANVLQ